MSCMQCAYFTVSGCESFAVFMIHVDTCLSFSKSILLSVLLIVILVLCTINNSLKNGISSKFASISSTKCNESVIVPLLVHPESVTV